jgi:excisionase family DNA binding protein
MEIRIMPMPPNERVGMNVQTTSTADTLMPKMAIFVALEQAVTHTPVDAIPELIGVLAQFQARARLKLLSGHESAACEPQELLTMAKVATRLSIPESRAYELARQGKIPAVRIGKYVRVSAQALTEYVARLPRA